MKTGKKKTIVAIIIAVIIIIAAAFIPWLVIRSGQQRTLGGVSEYDTEETVIFRSTSVVNVLAAASGFSDDSMTAEDTDDEAFNLEKDEAVRLAWIGMILFAGNKELEFDMGYMSTETECLTYVTDESEYPVWRIVMYDDGTESGSEASIEVILDDASGCVAAFYVRGTFSYFTEDIPSADTICDYYGLSKTVEESEASDTGIRKSLTMSDTSGNEVKVEYAALYGGDAAYNCANMPDTD